MIYLIRHAHAESRSGWAEPDRLRPLTEHGRREAGMIAARLASPSLSRILTSPHLRCVQTIAPLADLTGIAIEEVPRLAEGSSPDDVRPLIAGLAAGAVVCSHGDVIGNLIAALHSEGVILDGGLQWPKASTWELTGSNGRFSRARLVAGPQA